MWGKIIIPMYRLWLLVHGLYGLYGPRCPLSSKRLINLISLSLSYTVYPKKYAHGFVVLCFVVVMQSFIMNSHELFIHIHQGCFAGTGAIVRLPQCQWSKPDGYGKISQCITTTKHSKAKTVCIFLGIYCSQVSPSYLKMRYLSEVSGYRCFFQGLSATWTFVEPIDQRHVIVIFLSFASLTSPNRLTLLLMLSG